MKLSRFLIALLVWAFIPVGSPAQNVDSPDPAFENEMNRLYYAVDDLLYSDLDSAHELALIFYHKSMAANDTYWQGEAAFSLGWVLYIEDKMDSAKALFEQAGELFTSIDDKVGLFWVYFGLGSVASSEANYSQSISYYLKSEAILDKAEADAIDAAFLHYGIALSFYEYGDLESAIEFFEKADKIVVENNYKDSLPFMYNMDAELALVKGRYEEASFLARKALELCASDNDVEDRFYAYEILSRVALESGRPGEAHKLIRKAKDLSDNYGDVELKIIADTRLANTLIALGRTREALRAIEQAIRLTDSKPPNYAKRLALKVYSQILEANGSEKKALQVLKELSAINDRISSSSLRKLILQRDYESSLLKNEVLELQASVQDEKIQRSKATIVASVIVILLLIGLLALFVLSFKKTRKTNMLLAEKNQLIDAKSRELFEINEELRKNNRNKDQLLSILSHDLRQPFNQAESLLTLLQDHDLGDPTFNELVVTISESLARDKRSVDNLLAWSKSQLVGIKANPVNVNLKKVFDHVRDEFNHSIVEKKLSIESYLDDDCTVYTDYYHLEIILKNLLLNSIKFSRPSGKIYFRASHEGPNVVITLRDEGVGMSKTKINQLLDNKFHFSSKGTLNEAGSGLGMLIVTDFVKENRGSIDISSTIGEGTQFKIVLPAGVPSEARMLAGDNENTEP